MSNENLLINKANLTDLDGILALLTTVNLPIEGVKEHLDNFLVVKDSGATMKGCIGLELYKEHALLRSAAVHPENQGQGIGKKLTKAIISLVKQFGVQKLYLITDTAERFFRKEGFAVVSRDKIPASVKESVEFTFSCAKTGVSMIKELK
ncbi:MAG: GNAT family N-acetyltransferase [Candidatus Heimdallarchaeota archaeon]